MNKKIYALAAVAIALGLILSACTRSATNKGATVPTATSEIPFPVGTLDTSARVTEIVQQTKAALDTPIVATKIQTTLQATPIVIANTQQVVLPTATKTIPPIPTATRPTSYTLQQGEWPICIARRFNLDLESFLDANGLVMDSRPAAGTVLQIPSTGTWSAGDRALKSHPTSYTVKSGDTIYTVGCAFGDVDPQAIIVANDLQSPYNLTPGDTIQIP
jgi:LysM repeat protein